MFIAVIQYSENLNYNIVKNVIKEYNNPSKVSTRIGRGVFELGVSGPVLIYYMKEFQIEIMSLPEFQELPI